MCPSKISLHGDRKPSVFQSSFIQKNSIVQQNSRCLAFTWFRTTDSRGEGVGPDTPYGDGLGDAEGAGAKSFGGRHLVEHVAGEIAMAVVLAVEIGDGGVGVVVQYSSFMNPP